MDTITVWTAEGNLWQNPSVAQVATAVSDDWAAIVEIRMRANGLQSDYNISVSRDGVYESDCITVPVGSDLSLLLNFLGTLGFQ